ncbi:MAG: GNAT family N-acetyltransferase [Brumimicrobium sp.]|nr:GNAT family N-acetyltransferase [Brumimicrobium sp.]MCO5269684.1 GNAT family N-acetyltransferase [Brumimicrobium sp.]
MIIRKAKHDEAYSIAPLLLSAMEGILYDFIGEVNAEKALSFLTELVSEERNQYSYENCWVVEDNQLIIAAACAYDGNMLTELREPVAQKIMLQFHKEFSPEDETDEGEIYIDSIGVSTNYQGKGIGTKLLQFLIDEYVYKQNKTLGLLVEEENPQAKKLYIRLGFQVQGIKLLTGKKLEHLQISPLSIL